MTFPASYPPAEHGDAFSAHEDPSAYASYSPNGVVAQIIASTIPRLVSMLWRTPEVLQTVHSTLAAETATTHEADQVQPPALTAQPPGVSTDRYSVLTALQPPPEHWNLLQYENNVQFVLLCVIPIVLSLVITTMLFRNVLYLVWLSLKLALSLLLATWMRTLLSRHSESVEDFLEGAMDSVEGLISHYMPDGKEL